MKRRDSLASLFSGHGSCNLFGEDKELLANSDDDENRVIPLKDVTRPSFFVGKGDSSSSLSVLSDEELRVRPETGDQRNNLVNKKESSRERLHLSLSDLFSRVGKPKIQTSRGGAKLVERQQKSKVFDRVPQVILYIYFFHFKYLPVAFRSVLLTSLYKCISVYKTIGNFSSYCCKNSESN